MKKRLIKKAKSGWTTYLNPKNWDVKDIDTENFKDAFYKAKGFGLKEFLWNGKRYHTREADVSPFLEQYFWLENYIKKLNPHDIKLSRNDSTDASLDVYELLYKLGEDPRSYAYKNNDFDTYNKWYLEFKTQRDSLLNNKYYNFLKKKLNKIKNNFKNLKLGDIVYTSEPNPRSRLAGRVSTYNKPPYQHIYTTSYPGTVVHELSHAIGLDEIYGDTLTKYKNFETMPKHILDSQSDLNFLGYPASQWDGEFTARDILKKYVNDKKHKNK